jgi:hypothetical protein
MKFEGQMRKTRISDKMQLTWLPNNLGKERASRVTEGCGEHLWI